MSDGRCGSIGYGIATAYAKEGANLVITGRNLKKLEDAKEELAEYLEEVARDVAKEANQVAKIAKRKTVKADDIKLAIKNL